MKEQSTKTSTRGHHLQIEFDLNFTGRWRVGSGLSRGQIDRALLRRKERPFVPGSTLKGLLRQQCERLAEVFGLPSQDPHITDATTLQHFCALKDSSLIVDRLFGSVYEGECLFVEDCLWIGDFYEKAHIQPETRVSLDRATGIAKEGRLFTSESVQPHITLRGMLEALHGSSQITPHQEDTLPFEYDLLVAGLLSLERIGGDRSVGSGHCFIQINKIHYNTKLFPQEKLLASFQDEPAEWKDLLLMCREEMR